MPESDHEHPHAHAEGGAGAHDHPAGDEHGGHDAGHHPFSITGAILHHNMPYPAWEPVHGAPLMVFDLAQYAGINHSALSHHASYHELTEADYQPYLAWAEDELAAPDFRYDTASLEAPELAKAMAVAEHDAGMVMPRGLSFLNQQTFFGTVALTLLFLVTAVIARRRPDQYKPANRLQHFFESIVIYLRDEVVRPNIAHGADKWLGFLATLFLMILAVNLFGLIPGTGTMSGNIGVTGAWSVVILGAMLFFGMKEQGPKFWINLVPIHFSWAMSPVWVLLLVIELMGLIIKPAALAIRLFANMFAGHTVLVVFLSLGYIILASNPASQGLAVGLKGFGWLLAVAFHAMEVLVAFIQAYVFTLLSALFIGMSIHPEH